MILRCPEISISHISHHVQLELVCCNCHKLQHTYYVPLITRMHGRIAGRYFPATRCCNMCRCKCRCARPPYMWYVRIPRFRRTPYDRWMIAMSTAPHKLHAGEGRVQDCWQLHSLLSCKGTGHELVKRARIRTLREGAVDWGPLHAMSVRCCALPILLMRRTLRCASRAAIDEWLV